MSGRPRLFLRTFPEAYCIRSGITSDPEDPEKIVRLVRQVVGVSLETVRIVRALPGLEQVRDVAVR